MNKLIELELKRNNLKNYYRAIGIISLLMTGFIYMIAVISKTENDKVFSQYENIFKMHTTINLMIFAVFSTAIYAKIIIEEYSKPKVLLIFSYPVPRTKIFMAKLIVVTRLVAGGFLIGTLLPDVLFSITETVGTSMLGSIMTWATIKSQFLNVMIFLIIIIAIGFISVRVGMAQMSVLSMNVTAIILVAVIGTAAINSSNQFASLILALVLLGIGIVFISSANSKINSMEV